MLILSARERTTRAHALVALPRHWEARADPEGRVYYVDQRSQTTTWRHPLVDASGCLVCQITHAPIYQQGFVAKLSQFRRDVTTSAGEVRLDVRRDHVVQDSIAGVLRLRSGQLKQRIRVVFDNEPGLDFGGVSREWLALIAQELIHPNAGLFTYTGDGAHLLDISPLALQLQPDWKESFQFLGRLFGIALRGHYQFPALFSDLFFERLRKEPFSDSAFREAFPTIARSIDWLKQNTVDESLALTFSVLHQALGETMTVDLVPDGQTKPVTEGNKAQYIRLLREHHVYYLRRKATDALRCGLERVVPRQALSPFTAHETQLLLCGLETLDIGDWRQHAHYRGSLRPSTDLVQWFWSILEEMPVSDQRRVLQFATGSPRVPLEGFAGLSGTAGTSRPFTIERGTNPDQLPVAHTCFNRLILPPVTSRAILRRRLLLAVENSVGFGME